jgi:hypothetical protein
MIVEQDERRHWVSGCPRKATKDSPTERNVTWYRALEFHVRKEGQREPRVSYDGGRPERAAAGAPAPRGRDEAVQKREEEETGFVSHKAGLNQDTTTQAKDRKED